MNEFDEAAYRERKRSRDAFYDTVEQAQADATALGYRGEQIYVAHHDDRVSLPVDMLADMLTQLKTKG